MPTLSKEIDLFIPTLSQLERREELREGVRSVCKTLYYFFQHAWPHVPGTGDLTLNPHIKLVCDYLQALWFKLPGYDGVCRDRLAIHIPPESLKSSLVSVVYPAWIWTVNPRAGVLGVGYSDKLQQRDATNCRMLIESPWYQMLWGKHIRKNADGEGELVNENYVQLREDQNAKNDYRTTLGGWRLATTINGRVTGEHPDLFNWDDALKVQEAYSNLARLECRNFYTGAMATRGAGKGVRHLFSWQRVHPNDPGEIFEDMNKKAQMQEQPEPCMILKLAMEYDQSIAMKDWGFGKDWRTKPGELLDPIRMPESKLKTVRNTMSAIDYAAQYQQNPKIRTGRFFKPEKLNYVKPNEVPKCDFWVRAVDKAATSEGGCRTACVLIGKKVVDSYTTKYYIRHVHKGQWDVDEVEDNIEACAKSDNLKYNGMYKVAIEREGGGGGKVSARSTQKRLRGFNVVIVGTDSKSKEERAKPFATAVAHGEVYVVEEEWTPDFVDEMTDFPDGKYKDQIDAVSMGYSELEGTLVEAKEEPQFMVAGLDPNRKKCLGCDRMAIGGADYCCEKCEIAFEMGAVCTEHDLECDRRA